MYEREQDLEDSLDGCPITISYLNEVNRGSNSTGSLERLVVEFETLWERAQSAGNSRVRLHQRAFLCVEIMATRGVSSAYNLGIPVVASLRWPKSAAGIAKLLKVLREQRTDLVAGQAEFIMDNTELNRGAEQLVNDKARRQIDYLTWLEDSAMLLRRSLRKGFIHSSLGSIGPKLCNMTKLLGIDAQLSIAEELLEQSEFKERRAWEKRIR